MRELVIHIQKINEHKRISFFDLLEDSEKVKYTDEKVDINNFDYNKYLGRH